MHKKHLLKAERNVGVNHMQLNARVWQMEYIWFPKQVAMDILFNVENTVTLQSIQLIFNICPVFTYKR